jgi:hypothetical protein
MVGKNSKRTDAMMMHTFSIFREEMKEETALTLGKCDGINVTKNSYRHHHAYFHDGGGVKLC